MTIQQLASAIAKREGKKSQARIGDIREILKIVCELDADAIEEDRDSKGPIACLCAQADKIVKRRERRSGR